MAREISAGGGVGRYRRQEWWVAVMPALAVFVVALLANLAGDGIRDVLGDR